MLNATQWVESTIDTHVLESLVNQNYEGLGERHRHHEPQPAGAVGEVSDGPAAADGEGAVRGRA